MDFENLDELYEEPAPVWEPIKPARSHLNFWLKSADGRFLKVFARLLRECGIIASEWAALRELYRPGRMSPVELGQAIGMSKGGASKLVSRLVAKGLAVKETAEFDRRFRSVGLTRQGRELVVFVASLEKDADREFFGPLGNSRRFRLTDWMKRVVNTSRGRQLKEWTSLQLKQRTFIRVDRDARAKDKAKAQAEMDALWELLGRVAFPATHSA